MKSNPNKENSLASASYIVNGSDLVDENASLLFDRIINIKFIRARPDRNGHQFFCIRSDYEYIYNKDGTIRFQKCSQKPSIRVKGTQVADSIAIDVKIEVDSLFLDSEIEKEELATSAEEGNPVTWALVQMGYANEFPKWDTAPASEASKFFDMADDSLAGASGMFVGKQMLVQILTCYPVSMPPERTWVFNGVIASMDTGLSWEYDETKLVPNYGNSHFPKDLSKIEAMFYQFVTRRFIRAGIEHYAIRVDDSLAIYIKDYDKIMSGTPATGEYTRLVLDADGLLKPSDADKLGVQCIVTEAVKGMPSPEKVKLGTFVKDIFNGRDATKSLKEYQDSIGAGFQMFHNVKATLSQQLVAFKNSFSELRWYMTSSGDVLFYTSTETSSGLFTDPAIMANGKKIATKLPAIYDITVSGVRTIRCPFVRILNPMDIVLFQSRYRISDETGFWTQPKKTFGAYLVILSSFEFATVDDNNIMTLTCVDAPDDAYDTDFASGLVVPKNITPKSVQTYSKDVANKIKSQSVSWIEIELNTRDYPHSTANIRWLDIARGILECASPDDWPSGLPTIERALTDLKNWNSGGVWNVSREKKDNDYSPENSLVPGLPFKIPWLYVNDTVIIRQPYKEAYEEDKKVGD